LGLRVGTFSALAVVMGSPGISQTQLGEMLSIKRSGVVVVVDDLERLGAVERKPVLTDRRAYALHVTPAGKHLWSRAEAAVQAHEAALFDELDPQERSTLQDLLVRGARSARHRKRETDR
jgi:DNA-binding MarR family transcriptional regulator